MAMKLKDLLGVLKEDLFIKCTFKDGTELEFYLNEAYIDISDFIVTRIHRPNTNSGEKVEVYVKEQEAVE